MRAVTPEELNEREYLALPIAAQLAVDQAVAAYTTGKGTTPSDIIDRYVGTEAGTRKDETIRYVFDQFYSERQKQITDIHLRSECEGIRPCMHVQINDYRGGKKRDWVRCKKHTQQVEDISNKSWMVAAELVVNGDPILCERARQESKQWHKLIRITFNRAENPTSTTEFGRTPRQREGKTLAEQLMTIE